VGQAEAGVRRGREAGVSETEVKLTRQELVDLLLGRTDGSEGGLGVVIKAGDALVFARVDGQNGRVRVHGQARSWGKWDRESVCYPPGYRFTLRLAWVLPATRPDVT
jgi:hypothetical protein